MKNNFAGPSRSDKKSIENRRRRKRIITGMMLMVLVEAVAAVITMPALSIHSVKILGMDDLAQDEKVRVVKTASLMIRRNLFLSGATAVTKEIDGLPWVHSVKIVPIFPDSMIVKVQPKKIFCILQSGDVSYELDSAGSPIRESPSPAPSLPVISMPKVTVRCGVPITSLELQAGLRLLSQLKGDNLPAVNKIVVDQRRNMCLNMSDGLLFRLGQAKDMNAKIEIMKQLYSASPDLGHKLMMVNLVSPSVPSCLLRPISIQHASNTGANAIGENVPRSGA